MRIAAACRRRDTYAAELKRRHVPGILLSDGTELLVVTAGALMMEKGGAMSHGAVIAREYGIPAVVGVAGALQRIKTGDLLEVDGVSGRVTITGQNDNLR